MSRSCPAGRTGFGSPYPWPVAAPGIRRSVIGCGLVGSSQDAILWSRACHTSPSPHLNGLGRDTRSPWLVPGAGGRSHTVCVLALARQQRRLPSASAHRCSVNDPSGTSRPMLLLSLGWTLCATSDMSTDRTPLAHPPSHGGLLTTATRAPSPAHLTNADQLNGQLFATRRAARSRPASCWVRRCSASAVAAHDDVRSAGSPNPLGCRKKEIKRHTDVVVVSSTGGVAA